MHLSNERVGRPSAKHTSPEHRVHACARSRSCVGFMVSLAGACSPPGTVDVAVPISRPRDRVSRISLFGSCGL